MMRYCLIGFLLSGSLLAQTDIRPVPPPGVPVPATDRKELESGLKRLDRSIEKLQGHPLLPDVLIFQKAVAWALQYDEFFKPEEIFRAKEILKLGQARADELQNGTHAWTSTPGLTIRGYVSKIDKSVQPYGLVIPASYSVTAPHRWRLDTWFHGRNETLSELNFLWDRLHNTGEFTPADTIVLHLYGRYCNANKLAGEVDLFEALDAARQSYAIDENRIVVRGFSMGGAAAWHIAAHHAGLWAAAAPGAGFSETPDFLKIAQHGPKPAWYEEKLWHLYNATDYAANLFNCPTVAYSGEIDPQKQAATMMERALEPEGLRLTHIIGPNTAHKYHPDSKPIISRLVDANAARGRDPFPKQVRFTTWTLSYNRMKWVVIDALDKHWERARLDAEVTNDSTLDVKAVNVSAFTLDMDAGSPLLNVARKPVVVVNGQRVQTPSPETDRSWRVQFIRNGSHWSIGEWKAGLRKRHGLQGPIDDAFLDSFIMVRPTGEPQNAQIAKWVSAEQDRAIREWRRHFRGDAQVKDDEQITSGDIANNNLVLWGDPASNRILARILDKLPIKWPGGNRALLMIYPNPLNPSKYVVLNSGVTFREFDYLNNARQVPKLPDWAVVDITTPPDGHAPGKIVDAGFFDETWSLPAQSTPSDSR